MRLIEITGYIATNFPESFIAKHNVFKPGCNDKDYNDSLLMYLLEFFSSELLGFVDAKENVNEFMLKLLTIQRDYDWTISYVEVRRRYKHELGLDDYNRNHCAVLRMLLSILCDKGILEYSGVISNCWMTDLGRMYFDVLTEWHKRNKC